MLCSQGSTACCDGFSISGLLQRDYIKVPLHNKYSVFLLNGLPGYIKAVKRMGLLIKTGFR